MRWSSRLWAEAAMIFAAVPLAATSGKGKPMPQIQHIDPMSGANYPAIEKAVSRLRERGLKVDDYEIKLLRKDDNLIVIFVDPHRPPGMRGSSGKPGFEVEMSPDLHVVRENFAR